jgi:uncharacterized protein YodC (DUF2158 family)
MARKRKKFKENELVSLASANSFKRPYEPELMVGDLVYLNSGSPVLMVTDTEDEQLTVALRVGDDVQEWDGHRDCYHRVRNLW